MTQAAVIVLVFLGVPASFSLQCYNGLKVISSQAMSESTENCEDSGAYCYKMQASAALLLDVVKAGCSKWRCLLARDTCIQTNFQGVPVSFCCCSSDRCNWPGIGVGPGGNNQGGWGGNTGGGGFDNNGNNQGGGWGGNGGGGGNNGGWGGNGGNSQGGWSNNGGGGGNQGGWSGNNNGGGSGNQGGWGGNTNNNNGGGGGNSGGSGGTGGWVSGGSGDFSNNGNDNNQGRKGSGSGGSGGGGNGGGNGGSGGESVAEQLWNSNNNAQPKISRQEAIRRLSEEVDIDADHRSSPRSVRHTTQKLEPTRITQRASDEIEIH